MTAVGMDRPLRRLTGAAQTAVRPAADSTHRTEEFTRFYETTIGEVYNYLYTRCGRRAQVAEDLTQEVYLAAVLAIRRGARHEVELPWLIAVARNKLVDHFRHDQRQQRNVRVLGELKGRYDDVARWREADAGDPLLDALASLPPLQRAALVLRHVDGLPVPDVAQGIGRTVRATESILSRARQSLRAKYGEVLDD